MNACTKWKMRRQPRNSVERITVRTQTGGRQAGRRLQIECTKLQLSGGARAEGNGVGFGAHADPMGSRPNVRDVRAQGVAKFLHTACKFREFPHSIFRSSYTVFCM